MSWSMTDDYRLYIDGYTPNELLYDYEHKNVSDWYMNSDDIVSNDIIPTPIGWQNPLPVGVWYMTDDLRITASGIPQRLNWTKPYPASVWYYEDELDHVFNSMIPFELFDTQGAFDNCLSLSKIYIPISAKFIGRYAFDECNALTSVTIASDCVYYDTSFPEDCEIEFYE